MDDLLQGKESFIFKMNDTAGRPEKQEQERQVAFGVCCKGRNLEVIKPAVKRLIKAFEAYQDADAKQREVSMQDFSNQLSAEDFECLKDWINS